MLQTRLTAAAFLLSLAAAAQPPVAPPEPPTPTVQVSAEGRYQAAPDTAIIDWEITGQSPSLKSAYGKAEAQAAQLRRLLERQGFRPEQARWSSYTVQPDIDFKTHRVTSYTVTVALQLELTDFKKIGPLLDAAGSAGLNALRRVGFSLKHMESARAAAIADGYRQAHAEAEALAQAAGTKLLGLEHASVDLSSPYRPQPVQMRAMLAGVAAPPPTAEFSPQAISVSAQVSATYRLMP